MSAPGVTSQLAIHGGPKVRDRLFPAYVTVDDQERAAVDRVLRSGILSNYLGAWHENFMGGTEVLACEHAYAERFGARAALAVNSNTSGLIAALGAIGVGPGDEVIVPPYSMSISATAPLFWGATPVFADVEPDTFCLDAKAIAAALTPRTKAIIIVDLFGQPFDVDGVRAVIGDRDVKIVEDAAQAPGALHRGRPAGLLGDVGVLSLNYHKHIHSGEGGVVLTNDADLADRIALIRNHAEAVAGPKGVEDLTNMIGFNFRMTEVEAAIAREQLGKLDGLLADRLERVAYFEKALAGFDPLTMPAIRDGATHAYYLHAMLWDGDCGFDRNGFVSAVQAELPCFELREKEGVKIGAGYVRPIYLLPLFTQPAERGLQTIGLSQATQRFEVGLCPIVEDLHFRRLISHEFIVPSMTEADIDDVVRAFDKVWSHRRLLPQAA